MTEVWIQAERRPLPNCCGRKSVARSRVGSDPPPAASCQTVMGRVASLSFASPVQPGDRLMTSDAGPACRRGAASRAESSSASSSEVRHLSDDDLSVRGGADNLVGVTRCAIPATCVRDPTSLARRGIVHHPRGVGERELHHSRIDAGLPLPQLGLGVHPPLSSDRVGVADAGVNAWCVTNRAPVMATTFPLF